MMRIFAERIYSGMPVRKVPAYPVYFKAQEKIPRRQFNLFSGFALGALFLKTAIPSVVLAQVPASTGYRKDVSLKKSPLVMSSHEPVLAPEKIAFLESELKKIVADTGIPLVVNIIPSLNSLEQVREMNKHLKKQDWLKSGGLLLTLYVHDFPKVEGYTGPAEERSKEEDTPTVIFELGAPVKERIMGPFKNEFNLDIFYGECRALVKELIKPLTAEAIANTMQQLANHTQQKTGRILPLESNDSQKSDSRNKPRVWDKTGIGLPEKPE